MLLKQQKNSFNSTLVFVVFPNDLYNLSFCHKIPVSGWPACFADIAVSTSDMSLFCNRKNRKKHDGLIRNDPALFGINAVSVAATLCVQSDRSYSKPVI